MSNQTKGTQLQAITYRTVPGADFREKLRQLDVGSQQLFFLVIVIIGIGCILGCMASPGLTVLMFPALLFLGWAALTCVASDMISIGEKGIAFPMTTGISMSGRTIRLWSDVESIEVISANGQLDSNICKGGSALKMVFKSGGSLTLPLQNFTRESVGSFVAALQEWGQENSHVDKHLEHVPRLWELENGDLNDYAALSYTKFWEQELANNYSFTAFVPLQVGHKLRSESLTVIKQIAAGGFSAIYTVKDSMGGLFVLKESVIPSTADEKTREKAKEHFRREAEILIKLNHPNIAKVIDHFVDTARDYLLLEYIEGPDARELVRRTGKQSVENVKKWSLQMSGVLLYLHEQNPPVVHRDISPDNIVINKSGDAILIDFGAANEFVGEATGTLVGKQAYMSPEQIRGKVTPQSDIYSLGATMFFLLTAHDPEPLAASRPRKIEESVPVAFDDLVNSCTKLDLSERVKDAEELQSKISAISTEPAAAAAATAAGERGTS